MKFLKNTFLITFLLFAISNNLLAKNKVIDYKQKKELKANEGLVLLVIKMNLRLAKISLAKEGKTFPVYSMKKLKPGTQMKIIKLKAGKYYWKEGKGYSGGGTYIARLDKSVTSFTVTPGKLNYPGTLEFAAWRDSNSNLKFASNVVNNSTIIATEINKKYPNIVSKYPLYYAGKNPDPFLEFDKELENEKK